jgi:hypothetical protein
MCNATGLFERPARIPSGQLDQHTIKGVNFGLFRDFGAGILLVHAA